MPRYGAARSVLLTMTTLLAFSLPGGAARAAAEEGSAVVPLAPPDLGQALATLLSATEDDAPGATPARLPACRYRDKATRYAAVRDWPRTLLDTNLRLPSDYRPWDLVPVSRAGIRGSGLVRRRIIEDLAALAAAARKAGKPLAVRSAYRSYATQVATFSSWVRRSGYAQALKFSARPGHSEHQLGTTVDFTTAPGVPLQTSFGESPAGRWLAGNGWKHGFIMSYPKGRRKASCYSYEPWHWRYVGKEMARAIHESDQVPRRYLWENFESVP